MKQASSSQRLTAGWMLAVAFVCTFAIPAAHAQRGTPPVPAPAPSAGGLASIKGFLLDSVHNAALSKALVVIEGANRSGATDADGHYRIDSIPPGPHRVTILHPLLDTLGVSMRTPEINFTAGRDSTISTSAFRARSASRTPSVRRRSASRGPAVMVGFRARPRYARARDRRRRCSWSSTRRISSAGSSLRIAKPRSIPPAFTRSAAFPAT